MVVCPTPVMEELRLREFEAWRIAAGMLPASRMPSVPSPRAAAFARTASGRLPFSYAAVSLLLHVSWCASMVLMFNFVDVVLPISSYLSGSKLRFTGFDISAADLHRRKTERIGGPDCLFG